MPLGRKKAKAIHRDANAGSCFQLALASPEFWVGNTTVLSEESTMMDTNRKPISAVMTRTVCQIGTDQAAVDTLALMQRKSVSSVLVVEDEMILGIVTERDIVRALHQNGNLRALSCVDLMQSPLVTVTETTPCLEAYHLMAGRGIRHLAVTDKAGHVLGIASEGDLMRDFGIEYYMNFKDVGCVMSTEVCRLEVTASIADAVEQMVEKRQSCVLVVDVTGCPVGVLTERDVVRLCDELAHPEGLTLGETMQAPVKTVKSSELLHEAVKSMAEARIRRLVVVDDQGAVCGLLTHHEIVRGLEGDYVNYLKEIVELQARNLQQAAKAIDEKMLLANILRSASDTAMLACDLDYRISYATPAVVDVLGLHSAEIAGMDLRETLKRIGWKDAGVFLGYELLAEGAQHYAMSLGDCNIDLKASLLIDAQHRTQGYLVLAQRA